MSQFTYGFLGSFIIFILAVVAAGYIGLTPQIKPFVVQSGSMEPAVPLGSVVFIQKSLNYEPGEVIAFSPPGKKDVITHRLISHKNDIYTTKGDANEEADTWQITDAQIMGKVVLHIPYLGYGVNFAKNPRGFILLVIIPATIIIYEELKTIRMELAKLFLRLRPVTSGGAPKLIMIFPLLGLGLLLVTVTGAFFLDKEEALNNIFATASIFPTPSPGVNPGDVVINEIMWGGSNDEWIELRNTTSNTIDISNWAIENAGSGSNSINIPGSQSIGPNGFYLIAENKNTSTINIDPDHPTAAVSLLDGGEVLNLRDASNQLIDTANATPGWLGGSSTAPRKTMERKSPPGNGTVGSNWQTATTHTNMDGSGSTDEFGTPKAANGL